jgi:hypothetical protein
LPGLVSEKPATVMAWRQARIGSLSGGAFETEPALTVVSEPVRPFHDLIEGFQDPQLHRIENIHPPEQPLLA